MICGNKLDLERDVDKDEATTFAEEIDVPYQETSAWTGENVKETFNELFQNVYEQSKIEYDRKIEQLEKEKLEGKQKEQKEQEAFKLDETRHSKVERDESGNKVEDKKKCCLIF